MMTLFKTIAPMRATIRRALSGLAMLAAAALSTDAQAAETTHPKDPLPPATCLSGSAEVTCGRLIGTYVITLHTTGADGITPDHVTLTPLTAGVTIVHPQSVYPVIGGTVKIVLAGANPGDSVLFNMEGTVVGEGSVDGSDLCCNGSIKVNIPKDIDCPHDDVIDVAIKKTGGTSPAPQVNGYAFHLAVTNVGAPFNGTNAIIVKDVVPAGMTFTAATGPDWMCVTLPAPAGSGITCTYTGAGPVSSGQPLGTIDIAATASGHAPFPPFENCASVGVLPSSGHGADSNPANNRSCVTVEKPGESTVSISKSCDPVVFRKYALGPAIDAAGLVSMCHIKVVTTGSQTGTLSVGDQLAGGGAIVSANSTTTPAWACSGPACSISGSQLNQTSSVSNIDVLVAFPDKGTVQESKNCAMLAVDDKDAGKDCTGFTIDDPKSTISVKKVCEPAQEVVGAINHFEAKCHITVSTTGPQSGVISASEVLSGGGSIVSASTSTAPAWTCTPAGCTINGSALNQTASTSVIDVAVSFPSKGHVLESQNCAKLAVDQTTVAKPEGESCTKFTVEDKKDDLAITVAKTCDSFTALASGGPWVGQCHVTVHVAGGPMPPFISIGEALHDVNQNRVPPVAITAFQSADPWTCPPMGGGVPANTPLNCTIPGASFPASGSSVVDFQVFVPKGVETGEAQNCASAAAFQTPDTPSSPLIASDQVCVPLPGGPKNPPATPSRLDVSKEVVSNAPMPVGNLAFPVFVTCSEAPADGLNLPNGPNGAFSLTHGQSALAASGTYSAGDTCTVSEGAIPPTTGCGNLTPRWTTSYLPSASVLMNAPNQTVTIRNQLDCEPVNDQAGGFSVTKTCDPAVQTPGAQNVTAWCRITVTVTGTPPSTINVGETLQAFASPANRIDILNSAENWTYPALPIISGAESVMTIPSSAILAAGGTSVINVRVELADAGTAMESQNCVRGAASNGNEGIDHPVTIVPWKADTVCVPFTVSDQPQTTKPAVTVEKTCTANPLAPDIDQDGLMDTFTCQIKVVLSGNPTGDIKIQDLVSLTGAGTNLSGDAVIQSMTSADPWNCNANGPVALSQSAKYCTIPAAALAQAGGTSIINVTMADGPNPAPGEHFNCANNINDTAMAVNADTTPMSCARIDSLPLSKAGNPATPEMLKCDPATATPAGDLCRCRFDNMNPVSKTACECKDGFTLKAGQGCVRKVVAPACDPATTVTKGGKCVCEYKNMVQSSATACACAKGFKFAAGKGCFRPEPVCKQGQRYEPSRQRCEPICGKGFDYSIKRNACIQQKPDCPAGTVYSAKTNRCIPAQPVCKPPFVYDAKRKACVQQVKRCEPGTIPFKGKCLKAPKCGFGEIPVPGTGICVSIGGGGGRPKGGGDGPKDTGGCIPTATRACD